MLGVEGGLGNSIQTWYNAGFNQSKGKNLKLDPKN